MINFKEIIEKTDFYTREIQAPNTLHETLKKHYTNFSKENKSAIASYTGSGYINLNRRLWNGENDHHLHADLSEAMKKHKTPHAFTVYSGVKYDPREHMNSEGIVHHPAYMSTSIRKSMARIASSSSYVKNPKLKTDYDYKDNDNIPPSHYHMLKINVPKGHSGAYVDHISSNSGEHEFILPAGTKMKHKRTTIEIYPLRHREINYHIHHMEIVK